MANRDSYIEKINRFTLKKRPKVDITASSFSLKIDLLQIKLNYRFRNLALLFHALTHKSAIAPEKDSLALGSNERLECLGDSILDFLTVEELYGRYPQYPEGKITEIKSLLVSRKILGEIASSMDIMELMILGKSASDFKNRKTDVSANTFEALIAAIYLDSDIDTTRKVLKRVLFSQIDIILNNEDNVNYKAIILEYCQKHVLELSYNLVSTQGADHDKIFTVEVEIGKKIYGNASGKSKKKAEQNCAKIAASKLGLL